MLIRREGKKKEREKKKRWRQRQRQRHRTEIGVMTIQRTSSIAGIREKLGDRHEQMLPLSPQPVLLAPSFQTSRLLNCEINFFCFKPLHGGNLNPMFKDERPVVLCVRRYRAWWMDTCSGLSHFTENFISSRQSCHQDLPGVCPPSILLLWDEGDAEA